MNHLVFRVFCIVLVVVINSEIGASLNYKDSCAGGASCADAALVCTDDACACATTHFANNADDACVSRVAIDGSCDTAVNAVTQCAITNQVCSLESGSAYTCQCTSTYYSDGSSACVTKVVIDGTCDNTVTATDQCAIANQVCSLESGSAYTCQCTSAYYSDGSANCVTRIALDTDCTSSDQCEANMDCRENSGGTKQCQCTTATHYKSGSSCVANIVPDGACSATDQCVTNAECDTTDTNKCKCTTGFTATPTASPTMCSGVVKFASLSYMYVVPILVSMMSLLR